MKERVLWSWHEGKSYGVRNKEGEKIQKPEVLCCYEHDS